MVRIIFFVVIGILFQITRLQASSIPMDSASVLGADKGQGEDIKSTKKQKKLRTRSSGIALGIRDFFHALSIKRGLKKKMSAHDFKLMDVLLIILIVILILLALTLLDGLTRGLVSALLFIALVVILVLWLLGKI